MSWSKYGFAWCFSSVRQAEDKIKSLESAITLKDDLRKEESEYLKSRIETLERDLAKMHQSLYDYQMQSGGGKTVFKPAPVPQKPFKVVETIEDIQRKNLAEYENRKQDMLAKAAWLRASEKEAESVLNDGLTDDDLAELEKLKTA